jgi:hypothetical protein
MDFNPRTYPLETALHGFEQFRYRFRLVFPESRKQKLNGSRGIGFRKNAEMVIIRAMGRIGI